MLDNALVRFLLLRVERGDERRNGTTRRSHACAIGRKRKHNARNEKGECENAGAAMRGRQWHENGS